MQLFNSLSRKIEEFRPIEQGKVGIYICGPTVYDYSHIGHARTYINSDVLVRLLRWLGYEVKVVMNITDVGHLTSDADSGEDKLEKKARQEKKDVWQIAEYYSQDFWEMAKLLNIRKPEVVCKATEHIGEMIELVKRLEAKGFTYRTSDGIYFDTGKFPEYGKLARIDKQALKEGARVAKNREKRNATDFAIWRFAKPGEKRQMEWDSPWGKGFPGWHFGWCRPSSELSSRSPGCGRGI
jgi:cysteinyl-tRNA synthetase